MAAKSPSYIESHSALRGVAALVVFLDHLRLYVFMPTGLTGRLCLVTAWADISVFLFFVLSGFVMSYVYTSPVGWKHFFVARVSRLVPVYEVTLAIAVLEGIIAFGDKGNLSNIAANAFMIQEWIKCFGWTSINGPSWSLSVEALLYVAAFPLLILSRRWLGRDGFYFVLLVGGVLWGTFFYNYYFPELFHHWYLPILCGIFGFGAGFALHNLMAGRGQLPFNNVLAALGAILIATGILYRVYDPTTFAHGPLVLGLVLIVATSINPKGLPYRLLAIPPLVFLGDISYSLYLWHMLVVHVLVRVCNSVAIRLHHGAPIPGYQEILFAVIFIVVIAVSTASYRFLEVPCRRLIRDRFVRPVPGMTASSK